MTPKTFALILALFCFIYSSLAHADLRSEATSMLTKLKQDGAAKKVPDDLRSLDASIATAEMYFHLSDTQNAEKYYRLAIQKANLIQTALKTPATKPELPAPTGTTTPASISKPAVDNNSAPTKSSPLVPAESKQEDETNAEEDQESTDGLCDISSDRLVGNLGTYKVGKKETLRIVAAKLGVNRWQLASMNRIDPTKSNLKEGQELKYNNRRIVPEPKLKDGILINVPDRMLYYFQKDKLVFATAVALGTPGKTGKYVWHTPVGKFRIVAREKDPTWTVPPSIQEEMRLEGKEVIKSIPPGPTNPLGKYAMKTSLPGILIHSTTKPWSIYTYASHGCIRVFPQRMEELFKIVKVNTTGEIIYRPVKAAVTDQGKVLLEVHGDIYSKTKGIDSETKAIIASMKLSDKVDWTKVKKVVARKSGVAEDVTLETAEAQKELPAQKTQSPS